MIRDLSAHRHPLPGFLVALAILTPAGLLSAQEQDVQQIVERGAKSYRTHCGSCHGVDGAGDGPLAAYLKTLPPALTGVAKRNQGVFPFEEVYDIVDGREVPGHGTRSMPVWGPAFMGLAPETDKKVVKEKVVELVYYLKSIQEPVLGHPKMGGYSP